MTPAEIKKTRLYRALAPCVRKEDREELARMLAMVPERAMIYGLDDKSLTWAFQWEKSPQGYHYWSKLMWRLRSAGHPN